MNKKRKKTKNYTDKTRRPSNLSGNYKGDLFQNIIWTAWARRKF